MDFRLSHSARRYANASPWLCFPQAAHALGLGMIAGGLASLIWIVAGLPTHPNWEATYAALLVLGVTCLLHSYFQRASLSKRQAAFAGVACGMVALALPAALPALTAIGAWLVLRHRLGIPQILLLGLGFLAVLMPWVIRNYRVFDAFIPVRGNFGLELALANNDCATFGARLSEAVGCFQRNHPGRGPEQLEVYARLGEVRYNQERLGTAIAWIRQNPARFLRLLVQRAIAFWFPDERGGGPFGFRWRSPRRVERIAIHTMTLLSPLGLWLLLRSNRIAAQLFALWLSVFPLTYYVLHFEDRYRWPIMWISFMLAALVLVKGLARLYDGAVQAISPGSARQASEVRLERPSSTVKPVW